MRLTGHTGPAPIRTLAAAALVTMAAAACGAPAASPQQGPAASQKATRTAAPVRHTAGTAPFLSRFRTVTQVASTVPADGDVNPYGIAVVPASTGRLIRGDTLVSNFNDKANVQGTGRTIMEISPAGAVRQFARVTTLPAGQSCPGGIGLTTALAVLRGGWVVVGSLPVTRTGALPAVDPTGCLIVLDSHGKPVAAWTSPDINGPWDLTAKATTAGAMLFVSNVLSRPTSRSDLTPPATGLCTVVRLDIALPSGGLPKLTRQTVIGSGFPWQQNKAALIQGPTGLAVSASGTLYVAETVSSSITAIPAATSRATAVRFGTHALTTGGKLNGPLGLTLAPGGDLIAVNGGNGDAVEITPAGRQTASVTLVKNGAGDLFGVTGAPGGTGLLLVNDGTNALDLFHG